MAATGMMAYPIRDSYSSYPQQYQIYHTRAQQPQPQSSSLLHGYPYNNISPASQHQQYHVPPSRSPQLLRQESSGSTGSEDGSRPSLPSISNLLGIADGDKDHSSQQAKQQSHDVAIEQRQRASYQQHNMSSSQRTAIPPTPPLRNDSVIENTQSPSTISTGSSLPAQPYFIGSALNNTDADQQRVAQANFMKRHSIPPQPDQSPYGHSPYNTSPYTSSPAALSSGSYYSPTDPSYPVSSIYHQRPLPSNFPPPPPMQVASSLPAGSVWEHHHYISHSSTATFPQSQDRYICQTCNKAFSRPSSLKIHSHSHTGEKPFKCPHSGCGKAFSVRSNMKRHERGCHTGGGGVIGCSHLG